MKTGSASAADVDFAPLPDRGRAEWIARVPAWAWVLLCVVVAIIRKSDAVFHAQLWAEDAVIFHGQAAELGWRSLLRPQAGYFHTVPRLIALAAGHWIDPLYQPAAYNWAALIVLAAVARSVASPRWRFPLSGPLALALVLVPQTSEVALNVTNLQWITAIYLVAAAAKASPASRLGALFETVAVAIVGTTGPFSIVLAPLYWFQLWRERTRQRLILAVVITAAGLIQLFAILSVPRADPAPPIAVSWWEVAGARVFAQSFLPASWRAVRPSARVIASVIGLLATIAVVALPGPRRRERLLFGAAAAGLAFAVGLRMHAVRDTLLAVEDGSRYLYDLRVILVWILIFLVVEKNGWVGRGAIVALAGMMLASADGFRSPPWPDFHWENYAPAIRAGVPADIPINPDWTYHYPGRPKP